MKPIRLDWLFIDGEHVALVFDRQAFAAFGALAQERGLDTTELITDALAQLFGNTLVVRSHSAPYD